MEKVVNLIARHIDIQTEDIKPDVEIRDVIEDSLDHIEMILMLEEEFEFDIPDEDVDKIITFQDLFNYIAENTGENPQQVVGGGER